MANKIKSPYEIVTDKILDVLKSNGFDIQESINVLRDIEEAFLAQLFANCEGGEE